MSALVEAGIRAFMRGDRREAERSWREALARDPSDDRAREYLAELAGAPAAPPRRAPAPAPVPAAGPGFSSAWDEVPAAGARIELGSHGGVELTALAGPGAELGVPAAATPPAPSAEEELGALMRGAQELFALGDFSGSLELVERILAARPEDPEALAYLAENEATLVAMYESKLGPLEARPRVKVKREEVLWLNLDHRAGFLLAQVDGTLSWEDLFSLSNLSRLDTARILARLVEDGVVAG